MAVKEHLRMIRQGSDAWDKWREKNPEVKPDLSEANLEDLDLSEIDLASANLKGADLNNANLSGSNLNWSDLTGACFIRANLSGAYLTRANLTRGDFTGANLSGTEITEGSLSGTNLREANLTHSDLRGADLREANLSRSDLSGANLSGADLRKAILSGAALRGTHLSEANLTRADLSGAYLEHTNLMHALLVETNFEEAVLMDCRIYGVSTWGMKLGRSTQSNLVFTPHGAYTVGVDHFEVAQFLYFLLYHEKTRNLIEPAGRRIVLLLGKFKPKREAILKAIWDELTRRKYVPVLFCFEPPATQEVTEPLAILTRLSRFLLCDLSDPRGIPEDLGQIISHFPTVPVQPLLQEEAQEPEVSKYLSNCPWVLKTHRYLDLDDLLPSLGGKVIEPPELMAASIHKNK